MIAPYDIAWNGALYPMGTKIPATEKRLIQLLTIAAEVRTIEDGKIEDEPAVAKTKK